jgi:predicted DNA-binding protein (MmcQ/YjbR family)
LDYNEAKIYFLSQPESWLDYPFGKRTLVFKIKSKMFGLLFTSKELPRINLKCDPEEAQILREIFPSVLPGYHMNKTHWNTILLERMIDNSYALVIGSLSKVERTHLEAVHGKRIAEPMSFN